MGVQRERVFQDKYLKVKGKNYRDKSNSPIFSDNDFWNSDQMM